MNAFIFVVVRRRRISDVEWFHFDAENLLYQSLMGVEEDTYFPAS